jgi:hypothetical protein
MKGFKQSRFGFISIVRHYRHPQALLASWSAESVLIKPSDVNSKDSRMYRVRSTARSVGWAAKLFTATACGLSHVSVTRAVSNST